MAKKIFKKKPAPTLNQKNIDDLFDSIVNAPQEPTCVLALCPRCKYMHMIAIGSECFGAFTRDILSRWKAKQNE